MSNKRASISNDILLRIQSLQAGRRASGATSEEDIPIRMQPSQAGRRASGATSEEDILLEMQSLQTKHDACRRKLQERNADTICNACPNLKCQKGLNRSVVIDKNAEKILLFCTACEKGYTVNNNESQQSLMKHEDPKAYDEEQLTSMDQVGIGDIYRYESIVCGKRYIHPVIIYDVNRNYREGLLRTIELVSDAGKCKIVKLQRSFADIKGRKNIRILRFMPLNCLTVEDTLQRALKFADGKKWQPENYQALSNNCQHFANWCKIGIKYSEDAEKYTKYRIILKFVPDFSSSSSSCCGNEGPGWADEPSDGWSREALQKASAELRSERKRLPAVTE